MLLSCAIAVPFVYFMCPETTGKTLEEIDMIFAKHKIRDSYTAGQTIRQRSTDNKVGGYDEVEKV